jgi:hypothetical protein
MKNKNCEGCNYYYFIIAGCDYEEYNNGDCPCCTCIVKSMCRGFKLAECDIRASHFHKIIEEYAPSSKKQLIKKVGKFINDS